MRSGMVERWNGERVRVPLTGPPGVILPVNPSTLHVWKDLQKFDPSGHPSAAVSEPSGFCPPLLPQGFGGAFHSRHGLAAMKLVNMA
jgi:hypothetical protein